MSLGFLMAGGNPIGAVDLDRDSIDTYRRLFPKARHTHLGGVEAWTPPVLGAPLSVVIGGPPCQGFSLARGLRFVDDPRNHLYKEFVRVVAHYEPRWFVMENVEGITNIAGGAVLNQILEDFGRLGYAVTYKTVNMAQYDVPQLRRRAIFVGNHSGIEFEWPTPTRTRRHSQTALAGTETPPYWSVNDALGNLNLPQGNFFAHRANSKMRGPRNRDTYLDPAFTLRVRGDEFALCEVPAQSAFAPGPVEPEPTCIAPPENSLQEFFEHPAPPGVTTNPLERIQVKTAGALKNTRRLTLREQARLQSFPDWVSFTGSCASQARQIGNAVPPVFAMHLFQQIFEHER